MLQYILSQFGIKIKVTTTIINFQKKLQMNFQRNNVFVKYKCHTVIELTFLKELY